MSTEIRLNGQLELQSPGTTDQLFCWEQVLRIRPSFRVSHPYAPQQFSAGLLALYALFSAIEESHSRASDSGVSRAKLLWWREQLSGPSYRSSEHPIVRRLSQTEILGSSGSSQLTEMMDFELDRLDMGAPEDEHELKKLCVALGYHPMRLELSHRAEAGPWVGLERACAVNGLVQLMRESSRAAIDSYWWMPSSFLSHQGTRRVDLQSDGKSEAGSHLMARICALGLAWLTGESPEAGDGELERGVRDVEGLEHPRCLHWLIQLKLNARLLKRLQGVSLTGHAKEFARVGLGDAWIAWRVARSHVTGSITT